jgi:hypothetical protein
MKIHTLAKFDTDISVDGVDAFEWAPIIFDTEDIVMANRASEGITTIELKSGYRITVAIKWEEYTKTVDFENVIDPKINYEYMEG